MNSHDHLSGGSYRREPDGSLTLLERTGAQPCPCEAAPVESAAESAASADEAASTVTPLTSRRRRESASSRKTEE